MRMGKEGKEEKEGKELPARARRTVRRTRRDERRRERNQGVNGKGEEGRESLGLRGESRGWPGAGAGLRLGATPREPACPQGFPGLRAARPGRARRGGGWAGLSGYRTPPQPLPRGARRSSPRRRDPGGAANPAEPASCAGRTLL